MIAQREESPCRGCRLDVARLSPRGKGLLLLSCVLGVAGVYRLTVLLLIGLHTFLSPTRPVGTEVLVVEGWLPDYMLDEAADLIRSRGYRYVVTTGLQTGTKNGADACKQKLERRGIEAARIHAIASGPAVQNTLNSARTVRSWLEGRGVHAVDIFTSGTHGRKSLVVFEKVFDRGVNVGVISARIHHYPPVYWWTSLRGTRVTLEYLLGYVYALCLPSR